MIIMIALMLYMMNLLIDVNSDMILCKFKILKYIMHRKLRNYENNPQQRRGCTELKKTWAYSLFLKLSCPHFKGCSKRKTDKDVWRVFSNTFKISAIM